MDAFFEFTSEEERLLNEVNALYDNILSPYATKNVEAVREHPSHSENLVRLPFIVDSDRILHNPLYNRCTDKTQVFSFYKNDDITRRSLHIQLVSKISRTIGRALRLNLDLIEAIALGHDIGHTPFGHKGEEFLSEIYQLHTGRYFNHNVHSVRILQTITQNNLTLQTLSGILSHNGEKTFSEYRPGKIDNFSELDEVLSKCYTEKNFHLTLHPNTLEGCVVRISDIIAYVGKDRQDLYKAQLSSENFTHSGILGKKNSEIISKMIINIVKNSIDKDYLKIDKEVYDDLTALKDENNDHIYRHKEIDQPYNEIIKPMMISLYEKLLNDLKSGDTNSVIYKHYLDDRILGNCYRHKEKRYVLEKNYDEAVTDFIASMTDDYFIDLFAYLDLDRNLSQAIKYKSYFYNL